MGRLAAFLSRHFYIPRHQGKGQRAIAFRSGCLVLTFDLFSKPSPFTFVE